MAENTCTYVTGLPLLKACLLTNLTDTCFAPMASSAGGKIVGTAERNDFD